MFPRVSLLYRLGAVFCFLTIMIFSFNSQMSFQRTGVRIPWNKKLMIRKIQDGYSDSEHNGLLTVRLSKAWTTSQSTSITTTTAPRVVNPHDYVYLINPKEFCFKRNIEMITYVHTAPKNYKKRQMIRETWGSKFVLDKYSSDVIFIMGSVNDSRVMDAVRLESDRYGDIVQEDFIDTYRNLTFKAIAALRWINHHCQSAKLVLKTDDDILVDIHGLMDHLQNKVVKKYGMKKLIACNQWLRMKVIRDRKSKWYVSKNQFLPEFFPPYCSGSAFVMSMDVVVGMYDASFYTPFFWVDDFYVTGLLVQKLNITHRRLNEGYMLNAKVALEKFKDDKENTLKFFHVHRLTQIYRMWAELNGRTTPCGTSCVNKTMVTTTGSSIRTNKSRSLGR